MKRTIASLALLRFNWDKYKRDFIEVFVPFIVTLISKKQYKKINEKIIQQDFKEEYGLLIPYYPMITILRRAKTRGYIKKTGNNDNSYVPVKDLIDENEFSENAAVLERKYNQVLRNFIDFCLLNDVVIDIEGADRILIAFLKEYDLDILFASRDVKSLLPDVNTNDKERYLISKFIQEANNSEPATFSFMVDIAFGHIIANTILYTNDLEKFQGKLKSCCYLDTGILFDLLGINYELRQSASNELIKILNDNGSNLYIFNHTYDELLGILNSCIEWVDNEFYDPLKASRALLFFKDQGYTSSEIESFIFKVEQRRKDLGIEIINDPDPNNVEFQEFQIDEQKLFDLIVNIYKSHNPYFDVLDKDYTLDQDVKSISSVNMLKKGGRPLKLTDAKHIFITTNSTLAYASRQYECQAYESRIGESYFFIPTAMTDVFIGTLLWGQSPVIIDSLNQKKLISNCYAAMQPTKQIMKKYIEAAEKEFLRGTVSEDEFTLLKVSRMARSFLTQETLNDPTLFTENTVPEILNNIRISIRFEEEEKFNKDREKYNSEAQQIKEQLDTLSEDLNATKDDTKRITRNIEIAAENISKLISNLIFFILALIAIVAVIFQLIPNNFNNNLLFRIVLGVTAFIFASASILTGFNIKGAKDYFKRNIKEKIIKILTK